MLGKILWSIPVFLVSAIYIVLGLFVGFFAKTSLLLGLLFLLLGAGILAAPYLLPTYHQYRKIGLWTAGLGYFVVTLLGALDGGGIDGFEWMFILLGLLAGGISWLCTYRLLKRMEVANTPATS